ncbi:MAG: preprotein translocase subunit SecA [Deltaproteobacteria bacterium]|nr:preprotein translocase subunit SecA [Deltaproteobacteria bacterium]
MIGNLLKKVFGSKNERELKRLQPIVDQINSLEPKIKELSDNDLKAMTSTLRERLEQGASLDEILPEAFAVVREASVRTLKMRHFDAQLIGGIVLHQGKIAEMKTGEGKTLAATLSVYLNALTGKGVHVVTVNDYLAKRDTEWMGAIYNFLGLSVGNVVHGLDEEERRKAYSADITYGTNNEFGFDYLRDNMKFSKEELVQREYYYAIVDEVDSILIDEARTPLIISGPAEKSTSLYYQLNTVIPRLRRDSDYTIDEKARAAILTEEGIARCEKILQVDNLYEPKCIEILHHLNQALKAHSLFKRDVDYIVKNGEVIIVDEFTGRLMPGRRYSEGLHQALEAKENVKVENENQTLASVTFQNYFRMYDKLAGMTGTADTEAAEFKKIYNLDVVVIPTNLPMVREDFPDLIYKTEEEKFKAAAREIKELNKKGQPVLVGTVSIDNSEKLSRMLTKSGIKHSILNAKNHEKEAEIIAQAGQMGTVTLSTNMAGRGTDIVLGEGVQDLGGLRIIGTERHESRRIDNQLRGRSGRQGDPGSSRFYLALEDDLLRIFGGERISSIMDRLGVEEGEPIEHGLISKAIENAQRKVEGHNFDIRKHLLEYDDVMNQQREVIYDYRREALREDSIYPLVEEMIGEVAETIAGEFADEKHLPEDWNLKGLGTAVQDKLAFKIELNGSLLDGLTREGLQEHIIQEAVNRYKEKEEYIGADTARSLERMVMLQTVDSAWKDHLLAMDHLKEGIGLRGYGQRDPLLEYKQEGFMMFQALVERIKEATVGTLFKIQVVRPEEIDRMQKPKEQSMTFSHGEPSAKQPVKREGKKVGRNAPCPCGSGKKYKKCCGRT